MLLVGDRWIRPCVEELAQDAHAGGGIGAVARAHGSLDKWRHAIYFIACVDYGANPFLAEQSADSVVVAPANGFNQMIERRSAIVRP